MKHAISLVAYPDRQGRFIFAKVPNERGRYLRTDKSVALVACPKCEAMVGEPCKDTNGYGGTTHYWRRRAAQSLYGHGLKADDLIDPNDGAVPLPEYVPDEHMEAAS